MIKTKKKTKRRIRGRKRRKKTVLSRCLGKAAKLLMVAVLIHYSIVLFQGDFPIFNSARAWIVSYIYNGPLAGLVQPACEKIWNWQYTSLLYDLAGLPALGAAVILVLVKRYIEHVDVISGRKSEDSWRSGGTYKNPSVPLWRRAWYLMTGLYSGERKDLAQEAETMAVCRVIYEDREAAQDMNTVREWRLDELIRRNGMKIKVEYDRQEKKMTLLLPDGSIKILSKGGGFTWNLEDNKQMKILFL